MTKEKSEGFTLNVGCGEQKRGDIGTDIKFTSQADVPLKSG